MESKKLIGPFTQIVTMDKLPDHGPISNDQLKIISNGGVLLEGSKIISVGDFEKLKIEVLKTDNDIQHIEGEMVLLPGLIDSHTHICFAGSRADDYALRAEGKSYLEIAKSGGGIMSTVRATRKASLEELVDRLCIRGNQLLSDGVTTCEVKSGYGLTVKDELKMLQAIKLANEKLEIDLVATALPAHVCPPEFDNPKAYLRHVIEELLPEIIKQGLAKRADIFIEEGAFSSEDAHDYLSICKELGFELTIHADQFSTGGSQLAVDFQAISADHLEASGLNEMELLAKNKVTGTVLPGASMGLGMPFAAARKMLDAGMSLVIASDWNPGSAPMGDLLLQSSVLGIAERLSLAETMTGITKSPAKVLGIEKCGILKTGNQADMIGFPCSDYQEIFYKQGKLKPTHVWKSGLKIK